MKRTSWLIVVWIGLLTSLAGAASKEPNWRGSGGWGAGMPYADRFDPSNMIRVAGEIVRIERTIPQPGMAEGYALVLRVRDQLQTVHLGPIWFLERQDYSLEPHASVEVTGSSIQFDGQQVIIATNLNKNGRTLHLRDLDGMPVWSSWRRAH